MLPRFKLDVIPRAGIIAQSNNPRKSVKAISHGDINSFTKYSVSAITICNYLSVAAADVEYLELRRRRCDKILLHSFCIHHLHDLTTGSAADVATRPISM
jgi:hypothetical protein